MGGPGTGKTTVVNHFLDAMGAEEANSKTITFSSLTSPNSFQHSIEVEIFFYDLPAQH